MGRYFIHIRDHDSLFVDTEGVEAVGEERIRRHVEETVREILRDEGGFAAHDLREVEVADESGRTVLALPFREVLRTH